MSMTQLVIGTACGFLVAQSLLYGLGRLAGWLQPGDLLARARAVRATPAPTVLSALIRYAAPAGVSVALLTLGVWAVSDYLAAKSAGTAEANLFDSPAVAPVAEQSAPPVRAASLTPPPPEAVDEPAGALPDPYADPVFKVQRKPHRAGAALSLKETLVLQSEARARNELLHELQQHVHRSQYDCEAADRADKYLKAGLDVWGFATWQVKYFPVNNYHGATLGQCRAIKSVLASSVDLQSAIAQRTQADPER
ncbi:MAG TPA: hypothetical protein VLV25_03300 [Steroidobacteraceae bacterium]|nr:hypothetical protein [Steroidobacteraceae bacterium]